MIFKVWQLSSSAWALINLSETFSCQPLAKSWLNPLKKFFLKPWQGVFRARNRRYYHLTYHLNYLANFSPTPLRFFYIWPLEMGERILPQQQSSKWTLLCLHNPLGSYNLVAYLDTVPLFNRTLSNSPPSQEILGRTLQYLKRFGYTNQEEVSLWWPKDVAPLSVSLPIIFHFYTLPNLGRPKFYIHLPPLRLSYQLRQLNQMIFALLISSLLIAICWSTRCGLILNATLKDIKTLQLTLPPALSEEEEIWLNQVWPRITKPLLLPSFLPETLPLLGKILAKERPIKIVWYNNSLQLFFTHPPSRRVTIPCKQLAQEVSVSGTMLELRGLHPIPS